MEDLVLNWSEDKAESNVQINPEYRMLEYRLEKIETSTNQSERQSGENSTHVSHQWSSISLTTNFEWTIDYYQTI